MHLIVGTGGATGDESVKDDIQKCSDLLAWRVSENGRMGHHLAVEGWFEPGDGTH